MGEKGSAMTTPAAILGSAIILAAVVAILSRWSLVVGPTTGEKTEQPIQGIYRLDRLTGAVQWCRSIGLPGMRSPSAINCGASGNGKVIYYDAQGNRIP